MEQFAAIVGQTVDEQQRVAQAYLSTPNLVGRQAQLARVRSKLRRAVSWRRGSSILIRSGSGLGRSRFLTACVLEAKLSGTLVAHAAALETTGDYGLIRALYESLQQTAPELVRDAAQPGQAILAEVFPQLADKDALPDAGPAVERAQLFGAVCDWFKRIARARPLLISVDDLHRADEPSAACLARLVHETGAQPLLVTSAPSSLHIRPLRRRSSCSRPAPPISPSTR